uniref:WD repeat domain phosphoinositide-interacting protein 3 n=1 Tax=Octactis speculum TaxID=3111310 RepID=A0A7S2CSM6_9STRA|mmetsp:Transcript_39561/g.53757  ORF Transcript_39561/g.53757 Transcript_39561/m.53757 type:complete len:423 (+) Transcript_39561:68-1336(+)
MSISTTDAISNELLYVGFNQDSGCFACGMDNGFRIYNCEPFKETFRRAFNQKGGIGIVEMLFRTNLLALVGGGRNPKFPNNIVKIWDDHQNRAIGELMFRSEVKAVKLRRDRVVVVLLHKIYVYRFTDLKLLDQIPTLKNPRGLIALCPDSAHVVLACPGVTKGHVRVQLYDIEKSHLIPAHESELAQIALNLKGTLLATASDKGTLIRVFDTSTGTIQQELRRGMDRAVIYCLTFNNTSEFLACSSDKGTAHIFSLEALLSKQNSERQKALKHGSSPPDLDDNNAAETASQNTKSNFAILRRVIPGIPKYVESEWSFAQIRGLESRSICAFGQEPNTLIVVSANGSYLMSSFAQPGECERIHMARFMRSMDEEQLVDDITINNDPHRNNGSRSQSRENSAPPPKDNKASIPPEANTPPQAP